MKNEHDIKVKPGIHKKREKKGGLKQKTNKKEEREGTKATTIKKQK